MDVVVESPPLSAMPQTNGNGVHVNGLQEPSIEALEKELPVVYEGQVPLSELVIRVGQAIYAELSELAETMPNMSDEARKRTLADWVVKTKKQVVKLYAVTKWARDAETVQKCMNITSFLLTQNQQFEDAIQALRFAKDGLDPARLRNHDLLTSLDVLTTGSYLRLPTCIKKTIIPPPPLTDDDIKVILSDMETVLRYRLRVSEIIPVEMTSHRIVGGRVYFTVPKLFETSLCLRGAQPADGWFFVHVEFLFGIGGDLTGLQEFPPLPAGVHKRYITEEADARLAAHIPIPPEAVPPGIEVPVRALPEGVVDAPLVRLFNFLQMMSLSYQLEILWYQAQRMRSLGWNDYLSIKMSPNRKTMQATYWLRRAPPPSQGPQRVKHPPFGGTLTISLADTRATAQAGGGPARPPRARTLARLQTKAKLSDSRPSDEVEGLRFSVQWEPAKLALGINIPPHELTLPDDALTINANCLDFEALLRRVLDKHAKAVLAAYQVQLQHGPAKAIFSRPGAVILTDDALRAHLCADEIAIVSVDIRTGYMNIRDTGDLASAGRAPRLMVISRQLHDNPALLPTALSSLRLATILNLVEQKAKYLGLSSFRSRNFSQDEFQKLGPAARASLFIQLANFPEHYIVIVITDTELRFALITTKIVTESASARMIMEDIAWLDLKKINPSDNTPDAPQPNNLTTTHDGAPSEGHADHSGSQLSTQSLKELYSYCCARVAYMNVERQFKLRGIPFTQVNPTSGGPVSPELAHIQSSLARSVPALCVQSDDILSGAPAAEAAMPNIRVVPLNWWSDKDAQVVTCVKLKYVQQPMGRTTTTSSVIRPSKRIIYDTTEAVVSFLSENVNTCVDEFLEEWARVSKMVVIAREVAQMAKKDELRGVRLLSFDLQTVEFVYALDYTVSLSCEDQLSPTGGNFVLRFGRYRPNRAKGSESPDDFNPHDDAEPFFRNILRHGHGRLAPSLHRLVLLLRETLPIVAELEAIRLQSEKSDGCFIDTFAKSGAWFRLLYGDTRHALDFRLMADKRIAIIDGSYPIIGRTPQSAPPQPAASSSTPEESVLKPIPQIRELVTQIIKEALAKAQIRPGSFAVVDVGIICDAPTVHALARTIHNKVLEKIS
ncbi:MED14-domain-containing protein [Pluteus cervinus]|uniref:MED14-domain-containing protein n=1 Tax=Pluteus cervinus TaxID=181527 RepID=A0ACD3BA32_9AGAR|nr:MED14-domain-containing protein [Pluteus cervinus]